MEDCLFRFSYGASNPLLCTKLTSLDLTAYHGPHMNLQVLHSDSTQEAKYNRR